MSTDNKKKKIRFTKTNFITILLIIALAFLAVAEYAIIHRDEIYKQIAGEMVGSVTSTSSFESSLPLELTTIGSKQYLVDKSHRLDSSYVPENLTTPYLNSSTDVIQLEEECGNQAKAMKDAASNEGIALIVSAGYVSYKEQDELYKSTVSLVGETQASTTIPEAGCSENQLGLAIDFTSDASQASPTLDFANSDAYAWLVQHAHEYGFILRYPEGKESITGYSYMPWHYRYVGVDVATAIYEKGADYTFEEYFNLVKE